MAVFSSRRVKIIVSDFHLGKGSRLANGEKNLLEDFASDRQFVDFLAHYMSGVYKRAEVELIINGDFFNLLQVDYRDQFTDLITEGDSLHKLRRIRQGHLELFAKLSEFSRAPNHRVTFILGNHDPGLLWEGVQQALREYLKGEVHFVMNVYQADGLHIEHGNQYQVDNRYNTSEYFLTKNLPEPIIHLPFGSFFVIHYLNEIKKKRSYIDKIYPFGLYLRWALIHDTWFAIKSLLRLTFWFFRFLLTPNPAKKVTALQVLGILKETTLHPKLHLEAKRILMENPECRIVVFGHTHQHAHRNFAPGKDYFNTGTWNEKISLEVGTLGRVLRLTFVQIDYDEEGLPQGRLKEWKGRSDVIEEVLY